MTAQGTLLDHEVGEQPEVLARLLDSVLPRLDELRAQLRPERATGVVLVARGSSDNAARYAQYLFGLRLGLPVALATPSLHTVYGTSPQFDRQIVVAVSQSGASPDVVEVLRAAREQGCPALAVTNDPQSPLAAQATLVLDLAAGEERSVAATKTYTASLLAMALLAVALGPSGQRSSAERELRTLPDAVLAALQCLAAVESAGEHLVAADRAVTVGRGLNLATAYEAALKITELSGMLVAPFSPADLLHGPIAAVGPSVPVLLVAPAEPSRDSVLDLVPALRERAAPVLVITHPTPGRGAAALDGADVAVPLPLGPGGPVAPWLSPLVSVLPAQLLAARLAALRGADVDRPAGLTKVTSTR
ncbi:MAG: SIS domain-containing protein [Actinomycetota bacterium]|nr:SIS domain-containing protein [Actinomycetota bacterium]